MRNSRLGLETRAISEGAIMAAMTAIMAMAGIFIPIISPVVMLVWTLPVVLICMRHGMKAGAVTLAVAGIVIMNLADPMLALDMFLRSAAPALIIGNSFRKQWRTEKTVLFTSLAAFLSLLVSFGLPMLIMGTSLQELYAKMQEMLTETIAMMAADENFLASLNMNAAEMEVKFQEAFSMLMILLPGSLLIYSLFSALTNYMVARFVLRRLKTPLPPATSLATFRLPLACIFGFLFGYALTVFGESFWPEVTLIVNAGQNITMVFLYLYIFQGLGLISHYMGKAPPSIRASWKFMIVLAVVVSSFRLLGVIGYAGIADAIFDFRKLEVLPREDGKEKIEL